MLQLQSSPGLSRGVGISRHSHNPEVVEVQQVRTCATDSLMDRGLGRWVCMLVHLHITAAKLSVPHTCTVATNQLLLFIALVLRLHMLMPCVCRVKAVEHAEITNNWQPLHLQQLSGTSVVLVVSHLEHHVSIGVDDRLADPITISVWQYLIVHDFDSSWPAAMLEPTQCLRPLLPGSGANPAAVDNGFVCVRQCSCRSTTKV